MPKKLFEKGNAGKPKGAVNKNSKLIKEVFAEAFYALQSGSNSLEKWGDENPTEFYKLAVRLIPNQMELTANVNISDEPVVFE